MKSPVPGQLKAARLAAGMTQRQLGEHLGMEPNLASARMTQYEKGQHSPKFQLLKRLSDILDVPVTYFYCEDNTASKLTMGLHRLDDKERQQLLQDLQKRSSSDSDSSDA
ncbi:helix-turn-helix transcriptional regulator [Halomonas sp. CH40]